MKIKLQNKMKRFQQGKVSGALKVDTFMYLLIGKEYKHKYKTRDSWDLLLLTANRSMVVLFKHFDLTIL